MRWPLALSAVLLVACGTGVRLGAIHDGGTSGDVTAVAVALTHQCAIRGGSLFCEGFSLHGELVGTIAMRRIDGIDDAAEVAAGKSFTCVRHADGGVSCVGANDYGQLGRGSIDENSLVPARIAGLQARAIAAGADGACAITNDDRLYCWGRNDFGQVAPSSSEMAIRAPVELTGLLVRRASLGLSHTCVVTTDGRAFCFGRNASGELGDGTGLTQSGPVEVLGLGAVARVEVSDSPYLPGSSCALRTDATIACWGDNSAGGLGNGDGAGERALAPVDVAGIADAQALWLGGKSVALRRASGTYVWGSPGAMVGVVDESALPWLSPGALPALDRFADIEVGLSGACGIDAGRLYCWGNNEAQQFAEVAPGAIMPITEMLLPP